MAFDKIWEKIFQEKEWGKYPSEDVIRFIAKNFYQVSNRKTIKILDMGCGTGAVSWYLAREGFDVFGIDGSTTGIEIAKKRFQEEGLQGDFRVGDIINLNYPNNFFDCVLDIAVLQHNDNESIKKILSEVMRVLKNNGLIFCIINSDKSVINNDVNIHEERYVHYFSIGEITSLFSGFNNLKIDELIRTDSQKNNVVAHHLVTGVVKK